MSGYGIGVYGGGAYGEPATLLSAKSTLAASAHASLSGVIVALVGKATSAAGASSGLAVALVLASTTSGLSGSSGTYGALTYGSGLYGGAILAGSRPAIAAALLRGDLDDATVQLGGSLVTVVSVRSVLDRFVGLAAIGGSLPGYGIGAYGTGTYAAPGFGSSGTLAVAAGHLRGALRATWGLSGVSPAAALARPALGVRVPVPLLVALLAASQLRGDLDLIGAPIRLEIYVGAPEARVTVSR